MNGSSDYELDWVWVDACFYTQDLCCHPELDVCSCCPERGYSPIQDDNPAPIQFEEKEDRMTDKTEELGNLIYQILKKDEITKNMGNRGYVTDILSEAITKAGYIRQPEPPADKVEALARKLLEYDFNRHEVKYGVIAREILRLFPEPAKLEALGDENV